VFAGPDVGVGRCRPLCGVVGARSGRRRVCRQGCHFVTVGLRVESCISCRRDRHDVVFGVFSFAGLLSCFKTFASEIRCLPSLTSVLTRVTS